MLMFRVRAASFSAGFATAAAIAMYFLQRDVKASHQILSQQADKYYSVLDERISKLESASKEFISSRPHSAVGQDNS